MRRPARTRKGQELIEREREPKGSNTPEARGPANFAELMWFSDFIIRLLLDFIVLSAEVHHVQLDLSIDLK